MGTVIVCGSGVVGLAAATMLARDGHTVTVLDSDSHAAPDPGRAWEQWRRPGVAQFRQPHTLLAGSGRSATRNCRRSRHGCGPPAAPRSTT